MSGQARNELIARRLDVQEFRRLRKVIEAQDKALRRIMHYPFAVTSDDQADLRAVKDIAAEAVAASDPHPDPRTHPEHWTSKAEHGSTIRNADNTGSKP